MLLKNKKSRKVASDRINKINDCNRYGHKSDKIKTIPRTDDPNEIIEKQKEKGFG